MIPMVLTGSPGKRRAAGEVSAPSGDSFHRKGVTKMYHVHESETNTVSAGAAAGLERLKAILAGYDRLAVAFSGGVDSTLLLRAAHETLGDRVLALTAVGSSFPRRESREASDFCAQEGVPQREIIFREMEVEGFADNPVNRCYLCKKTLFGKVLEAAHAEGYAVVAEGSNTDDAGDYRPGLAALKELGIASPLRQAGLSKADIRELCRMYGLPVWSKPSYACLATRFPYGEHITEERLHMVEAAEQKLLDLGFTQQRVRVHGTSARIEVLPDQFPLLLARREEIAASFAEIGFAYTAMDLLGYRTGSMNETLTQEEVERGLAGKA